MALQKRFGAAAVLAVAFLLSGCSPVSKPVSTIPDLLGSVGTDRTDHDAAFAKKMAENEKIRRERQRISDALDAADRRAALAKKHLKSPIAAASPAKPRPAHHTDSSGLNDEQWGRASMANAEAAEAEAKRNAPPVRILPVSMKSSDPIWYGAPEDRPPGFNLPSSGQEDNETVYVTPSGKRYHHKSCYHLRNHGSAISLSAAKAQGFTPCSDCF